IPGGRPLPAQTWLSWKGTPWRPGYLLLAPPADVLTANAPRIHRGERRKIALRLVRRGYAPAPAGDGGLLHDFGAGLGVVHGQPGTPLQVADQGRAELRVVGKVGVVGRE